MMTPHHHDAVNPAPEMLAKPSDVAVSSQWSAEEALQSFEHISEGRFTNTQRALEAYLKAQGVPPQTFTAELIMFMERSFKGAYRRGVRSHYQQIMPSPRWRTGDTLSEKLTRCSDKETFKNRFGRVGHSELLRRIHFEGREIGNLDFHGRMYLRLIDTQRRNLSRFFRDDAAATAFFREVEKFWGQHLGGVERREFGVPNVFVVNTETPSPRKAELVVSRKTEEKSTENPSSLLPREEHRRQTSTPNHLHLVFSSGEKEKQEIQDSQPPFDGSFVSYAGVAATHPAAGARRLPRAKSTEGLIEFHLWRDTARQHDHTRCISETPSAKELEAAKQFATGFREFFPDGQFSAFVALAVARWELSLKRCLRESGVWKSLPAFFDMRALHEYREAIFTWYRRECEVAASVQEASIRKSRTENKEREEQRRPLHIEPPLIGCPLVTAPGRTFCGQQPPESLEYQIASLRQFGRYEDMVETLSELLNRFAVDRNASERRIEELAALTDEELGKVCC